MSHLAIAVLAWRVALALGRDLARQLRERAELERLMGSQGTGQRRPTGFWA